MATVRRGSSNGSSGSGALRRTPNTRAIVAAVIGNALEWYDFVVFSFMTVVISKLFFPTTSDYSSILLTTATFGVAFVSDGMVAPAACEAGGRDPGRRSAASAVELAVPRRVPAARRRAPTCDCAGSSPR